MAIYPSDVSEFIQTMFEFGGGLEIDPQGYIINSVEKKKITVEYPTGTKSLMIFKPTPSDDDVIMINPFIESIKLSDEHMMFYVTRTVVVRCLIREIMKGMMKAVIKTKDKNENDEKAFTKISTLISPYMKMKGIDEKLIEELDSIIDSDEDAFFNIYYSPKIETTSLGCKYFTFGSTDPDVIKLVEDTRSDFGSHLRKRSWDIIEKMYQDILGQKDPRDHFKATSTVTGCPRLSSYMNFYCQVLTPISNYLAFLEFGPMGEIVENIPLSTFTYYRDNLDKYYKVAKNFVTPSKGSSTVKDQKKIETKKSSGIDRIIGNTVNSIFGDDPLLRSSKPVSDSKGIDAFIAPSKSIIEPVMPTPSFGSPITQSVVVNDTAPYQHVGRPIPIIDNEVSFNTFGNTLLNDDQLIKNDVVDDSYIKSPFN